MGQSGCREVAHFFLQVVDAGLLNNRRHPCARSEG
jgi:hypothetical protein